MTGEVKVGTFASSEINPNVYSYGENRNEHKAENSNESDEEPTMHIHDEQDILTLNQNRPSINWGVGNLENAYQNQ